MMNITAGHFKPLDEVARGRTINDIVPVDVCITSLPIERYIRAATTAQFGLAALADGVTDPMVVYYVLVRSPAGDARRMALSKPLATELDLQHRIPVPTDHGDRCDQTQPHVPVEPHAPMSQKQQRQQQQQQQPQQQTRPGPIRDQLPKVTLELVGVSIDDLCASAAHDTSVPFDPYAQKVIHCTVADEPMWHTGTAKAYAKTCQNRCATQRGHGQMDIVLGVPAAHARLTSR